MRQETMKILFFIKKGSLLKNGQAPIVVRVTFNGVSDEARIQRSVEPRCGIRQRAVVREKTAYVLKSMTT